MARPHTLRKPRPLSERFWENVDKTADCWLWTGYRSATGYGRLSRGGRKGPLVLAHRLSWELEHGHLSPDVLVLHRCDVRNCVRPDHLFLGSQSDNVQDAVRKGRHKPPMPRKITSEDAKEIRRLVNEEGNTHQSVSDFFGVSRSLVSLIATGKRWIIK